MREAITPVDAPTTSPMQKRQRATPSRTNPPSATSPPTPRVGLGRITPPRVTLSAASAASSVIEGPLYSGPSDVPGLAWLGRRGQPPATPRWRAEQCLVVAQPRPSNHAGRYSRRVPTRLQFGASTHPRRRPRSARGRFVRADRRGLLRCRRGGGHSFPLFRGQSRVRKELDHDVLKLGQIRHVEHLLDQIGRECLIEFSQSDTNDFD